LDSNYVLGLLPSPSEEDFKKAVLTLTHSQVESISNYKYGIVMPAADRNLDGIFRQERPSMMKIKTLMMDKGKALEHLHENGIIHGDAKMLNSIRVNSRIVLIDMDASCKKEFDKCGAKFSSGVFCIIILILISIFFCLI